MILDAACIKQIQITQKLTITDAKSARCDGSDTARLWLLSLPPCHYDFQTRALAFQRLITQ
jgi:hypothetical protein